MDIKILDSHLREYLHTDAKPMEIAKAVSLTSASIERVEQYGKDFVYSVEITTNRPDMVSVYGLAREAAAVLPSFGFSAKLVPLKLPEVKVETDKKESIKVVNDDTLVRRVMGVIIEVTKGESPQYMKDRLDAAGIRSLNNIIDVTNYVMLEIGHPTHAFDYDRLTTKQLIIRPSKKGEKVITLDKKEHILQGGDIVADDGTGEIVDLLGVMGTANSVVTDSTKRVFFFLDNNDPWKIRKTSMGLAIRTEAAALNEKGVDPQLAEVALKRGVELYRQMGGKVVSDVIDIYPGKVKQTTVRVTVEEISKIIGVDVKGRQAVKILTDLGFEVSENSSSLTVKVPSWREGDVAIPEDVIEEVARLYGYHNIPVRLPPFTIHSFYHQGQSQFFWEQKVKDALKYWGLTEVYTYSMVSETLFEGPLEEAVTLANALDSEHVHMRATLTPSLLQVVAENKARENVAIFEIANVYKKNKKEKLPDELRSLSFVLKGEKGTFANAKGIVEQLLHELGIHNAIYRDSELGGIGASVYIGKESIGTIEVMESRLVTAELNFEKLLMHVTLKKVYKPLSKYPAITEDVSFLLPEEVKTGDVIEDIRLTDKLIVNIELLDVFENSRTFHVVYQDPERNLTTEDVSGIHKKIISSVEKKFKGKAK